MSFAARALRNKKTPNGHFLMLQDAFLRAGCGCNDKQRGNHADHRVPLLQTK